MPDPLTTQGATELLLLRHAPSDAGGRLAGRTDAAAILPGAGPVAALRAAIGRVDLLVASPARRCVQTAAALFPGRAPRLDARLWEQDFGAWEGCLPAELPDLGPMAAAELAAHRPPGGESFADLCDRAGPALRGLPAGRIAVVAHAGTVRAALALALGGPAAALAFEIAPLSLTLLRIAPSGASVGFVNRVAG